MAKDWFYQAKDTEQGPFTGTELKQLARQGEIVAETKIRKGPEGRWVPATQVQGLVPTPGISSPTDTISTIQVPPKEAAATKSVVVPKPKSGAEPQPMSAVPSQLESEPASNPFDPFAAFSNATVASSTSDATSPGDPVEDLFGVSDSIGNFSALKKKSKLNKPSKSTSSDSVEPKLKRKRTPNTVLLVGAGGLLAILLGVAGYFLIFKKESGDKVPLAKANPPALSESKGTSEKDTAAEENKAVGKASADAPDKTPLNEAATTVEKKTELTPVDKASKKPNATPDSPYASEDQLYEAVSESVALVAGRMSWGSGFLLEDNIVVTNKHVVESELIERLTISFPSAGKDVGPHKAELIYKDRDRDIAILRVVTDLKPTKLVRNYKFKPAQRVMAIGSPGSIDDNDRSENTPVLGNLGARSEVEHKKYYQMAMAVNGGNSGGPVFDFYGNVIGMVTLKSLREEAHAYCIPAEEVEDSLKKAKRVKKSELDEMISNHRVRAIFSIASKSSETYLKVMPLFIAVGKATKTSQVSDVKATMPPQLKSALKKISKDVHDDLQKYYDEVMSDKEAVSDNMRDELKEFWENFQTLKKSVEEPEGKLDAYAKKYKECSEKYAKLKPKLVEGLGVEFDH